MNNQVKDVGRGGGSLVVVKMNLLMRRGGMNSTLYVAQSFALNRKCHPLKGEINALIGISFENEFLQDYRK